jgi:hypothetical protein
VDSDVFVEMKPLFSIVPKDGKGGEVGHQLHGHQTRGQRQLVNPYSARLTHHKPKINDTKEYARLIYKWSSLDNILHKSLV